MSQNIKLITVDLDDTLWPCMPTIERAEQALIDWLAINAPNILQVHDVHSLRQHRIGIMQQQSDIAYDLTRVREISLIQLGSQFGYSKNLMSQANQHFREWRNRVSPYPEVPDALRLLANDYCLISVTNGNAEVSKTALAGIFHHTLTAVDVGAAKPDPAIFHRAAELGRVSSAQSVHIGDDPVLDVVAAQAIGMGTVWVNRRGKEWPLELPSADYEISSLLELPSLLAGWGQD